MVRAVDDWFRVLGRAKYRSESGRLRALMSGALSGFPSDVPPLQSVVEIRMRKKATKGTVGLTVYRGIESSTGGGGKNADQGTQIITFYSELLDRLSDEAAKGVIVHELAHAWLNEHVSPRSSKQRERETDELARVWGFGRYLDALDAETYPFEGRRRPAGRSLRGLRRAEAQRSPRPLRLHGGRAVKST